MKQTRYFHHILFRAALCLGLLWPCLAAAQKIGSEEAPEKPVWSQNPNDSLKYGDRYRALENRRALVGPGSTVNNIVNVVGVGSWVQDLNNLTDEDLNNYTEFPKIVNVEAGADIVTSVRDMNNHYAEGMTAGFCMVASSGTSILSLDVIQALRIQFFLEGKDVGTVTVTEGQEGAGVILSLISIPGSDDACINVTAPAPAEFDEIALIDAGVNLTVADRMQIKYAFVGDAKEILLTYDGVDSMNEGLTGEDKGYFLETAKGWNPVLLGIPFPLLPENIEALTNSDTTDYAPLTPIIAAGYQGSVKLCAAHHESNEEVFKAGDEVGFRWINGAALDLDVGAWIRILLFDRNGNVVQEETVSGDVVGLGVASGGNGMSSVVAERDFSGAEIRFHTVLSVSVGAMGIYYGFVREQPEIPHHCDINPTVSTNVCDAQNSFQLESNPDLSVTWSLVDAPEGSKVSVTSGGYVTNMDSTGFYLFEARAADGCTEKVYLNKGDGLGTDESELCGIPVVNPPLEEGEEGGDLYALSGPIYDSSGALISISGLKNEQYILDNGLDSAATYTGGLGLAYDLMVTGVKTTNGSLIFDGSETDAVARRVGFVVEFETTGLSLSALNFFQIRCYKSGEEVYRNVVTETNVVSLGLAGSNKVQKVRFCIDVPTQKDGKPIQFDEFQLWKSGVLDLTVSTLRIYYPFMEDATSECGGVMSCVTETISVYDPNTDSGTSASINGNETQVAGAVSVATVLSNLSYLIDNDGIPDCQDPKSCFSDVTGLTIDPLCVGDYMKLSGTGMSGTKYTLRMPEQGIDTTFTTAQKGGGFSLTFQLNTPGRYDMLFYDGSGNLVTTSQYSVHPLQTTWKTQPVSTDWNEWTNWTNGSPYCCTDVIIPTGATAYPLLSQTVEEGNADEYCCDDIHFEPGAAVDMTPRLNYVKAWAEMELAPNRYYLLSAPLKHTYTGDMFIPENPTLPPYFEEVTADNTPQNRFNPRIYQRLWATTAKGRLRDGLETDLGIEVDFSDGIAVGLSLWSRNFNHLAYGYPMGNGFSLWVDNGELPASQTFRFRFPKEHTSYNYYEDFDGAELDKKEEDLERGEGDDNKRFVYEGVKEGAENVGWTYERRTTAEGATSQQSRTVYAGELPLTVTLTSEEETENFLTGNPFMSRIYLKGFFKDNSDVTAVRVYDGEKYVTVNKDALSTADVEYIEPMQSFFVTLGAEASSATVTFDEASLNPEAQEEGSSGAETQAAALRVTADNGAVRAAALLVDGETTPVATLFDDEVPPVQSVFSLSDDEAFDIRNMGEDGCTSLGIYQPEKGDSLTLSFAVEHGLALADYRLLDRATGTLWALDAPVVLRGIGTSVNRYAVVPADYEPEPVAAGEVYVELQGTVATAYSLGAGIAQLSVFTTDGRRTSLTDGRGGQQASVSLSRGLHILQVRLSDGTSHVFKLLVR